MFNVLIFHSWERILMLFLCSISFACAELSEFCIAWQFAAQGVDLVADVA